LSFGHISSGIDCSLQTGSEPIARDGHGQTMARST
jgi:hypothetical protein